MRYAIETVFKSLNYTPHKEELEYTLKFFSEERAEVRCLIEKLSWNATAEDQQEAVERLADELLPCEYIYLVLPDRYEIEVDDGHVKYYKQCTGKCMWENAAKTIVRIGWPKAEHIIVPLFLWLLDLNWPGGELIYNLILSLPQDVLERKVNEILADTQNYEHCEYEDLKEIIEEIYSIRHEIGDSSLSSETDPTDSE